MRYTEIFSQAQSKADSQQINHSRGKTKLPEKFNDDVNFEHTHYQRLRIEYKFNRIVTWKTEGPKDKSNL